MRKTYRISVFNRTTGKRELMWDTYTSKKRAQEMADSMNKVDASKTVKAEVVTEVR